MRRLDLPDSPARSVFCLFYVAFQPIPSSPIFLGLVVHVVWDYHCEKGAHGSLADYAQEKPEREEQPERAPAGMGVPFAG